MLSKILNDIIPKNKENKFSILNDEHKEHNLTVSWILKASKLLTNVRPKTADFQSRKPRHMRNNTEVLISNSENIGSNIVVKLRKLSRK